jgi:hypothetical protein
MLGLRTGVASMFAPCLVLLLGGALPGAPARPERAGPDPAELRLFHAVVVRSADEAGTELPEEAEDAPAAAAEPGPALRKAEIRPTPEPAKEH